MESTARMPPFRNTGVSSQRRPETLAELLFYLDDPKQRRELESYRIKYEAVHGPTDLTRRYTSTWPVEAQRWLWRNDVKSYFDGFPPFAKAYIKGKMELAAASGELDNELDEYVRLFVQGNMQLDLGARRR